MKEVLRKLNLNENSIVTPFLNEEDGSAYQVWKIETNDQIYVLKKTTLNEIHTYQTYLKNVASVPIFLNAIQHNQEWYMLMNNVEGSSLSRCTKDNLKFALDALIEIQDKYWDYPACNCDTVFENRSKRLEYMGDLKEVYQEYLNEFCRIPVTLTHDDLLPFNVLCDGNKAVLIDWNDAGILPYATALARLIAYGEEDEHALFQMKEKDKQFALTYYYDQFISKKGIDYQEYMRTMNLFLFKEYSEWIYCAHLANDFEMEYYRIYEPKARETARKLGYLWK